MFYLTFGWLSFAVAILSGVVVWLLDENHTLHVDNKDFSEHADEALLLLSTESAHAS